MSFFQRPDILLLFSDERITCQTASESTMLIVTFCKLSSFYMFVHICSTFFIIAKVNCHKCVFQREYGSTCCMFVWLLQLKGVMWELTSLSHNINIKPALASGLAFEPCFSTSSQSKNCFCKTSEHFQSQKTRLSLMC